MAPARAAKRRRRSAPARARSAASRPAPLTVADYEVLARGQMTRGAFDYYAGGAEDERTLESNRRAFDRVVLRPRVLVDVSRVDPSVEVLGERLAFPILLAPAAFQRLAHPEGECASSRAARDAGTVMVASTVSTCTLEEIAAAGGPGWFQLYVYKDRAITEDLVRRAERAGYRALVLTVDTPTLGRRERDARNRFQLPRGIGLANFAAAHPLLANPGPGGGHQDFHSYVRYLFDPSLSWDAVAWLRSLTRMPVLLKGVMTPEDARQAVRAGVAGVVVSNHGGRQLDGAEATLTALPRVAEAVAGAIPVLMDGGIRRGTDVLKALALGARAVLIGRPYLWGLAAAGEPGVRHVLDLLRAELELAMALSGRPTIDSIDASLVAME